MQLLIMIKQSESVQIYKYLNTKLKTKGLIIHLTSTQIGFKMFENWKFVLQKVNI